MARFVKCGFVPQRQRYLKYKRSLQVFTHGHWISGVRMSLQKDSHSAKDPTAFKGNDDTCDEELVSSFVSFVLFLVMFFAHDYE